MARSEKKARRLVVDGETFLRSLGHYHRALGIGRYEDCCETLLDAVLTQGRQPDDPVPHPPRILKEAP
ncbi:MULTISPECIES: hypothetical protein [unclassified Streptomyces]|uniref:hypothetical protein n=1 Tax=unclassified Streptomyces TaxID=2593676 RepID=UPI0033A03302